MDVGTRLGAGELRQWLILPAAIARPASRDKVAGVVAPAVRLAADVIEGDICGMCSVEILAAVDATEGIPQVDGQSQVFADADAFVGPP